MALFLGQDRPARPAGERQGPHLGVPVLQRRLRLQDLHVAGDARRRRAQAQTALSEGALGDWISPAMVTRAQVDGKDSYVAVVPDKDCIVNKGDHSPRGGTNALTVYTTAQAPADRSRPSATCTRRCATPRAARCAGSRWDEALDLRRDQDQGAHSTRAARRRSALWAADHLSPEMNFTSTKLFFAPLPKGLYNPALGKDKGVAVRAIHNRPKWNSEHPSLADNFGSANSLLYSYRDFEIADTVLLLGRRTSYETGTVLLQPVFAQKSKKVVIDPRAHRLRAERRGPRRRAPAAQAEHRRRADQLADERDPERRTCTTRRTSTPASTRRASTRSRRVVTQAKYTPESTAGGDRSPGARFARPQRCSASRTRPRSCSRRA